MNEIKKSFSEKLSTGMGFAFGDLIDDIGGWLLFGVLLAGLIGVFVSPSMINTYLGSGFLSMLFMLIIATPLYVCATASTPIAAALVVKGISPGAALVFLLAGPATNVATITVVARVIGKKAATIYVLSILICSLMMGLVANGIYNYLAIDVTSWSAAADAESHGLIAYGSTAVLFVFILRGFIRKTGIQFRQKNQTAVVQANRQ